MRFTSKTNYNYSSTVPKSSSANNSLQATLLGNTSELEDDSTSPKFSPQTTSLAKVVWVDASTHGGPGWVDQEEASLFATQDPPLMYTVGWLLAEVDDDPDGWVVLTDTLGPEECSSVHKIPSCMVRSITYLETNR